ncbi:hypothetical protein [Peribacillus sp. TH24]|nr:hypothetical protein [Peribacillus sp. TH24]MBK5446130.1 hypothetical protein [Peribacillus sp. TH24]
MAIVTQQKGFKYEEMKNSQSQSVDEVNKVIDGFLDQVAKALGLMWQQCLPRHLRTDLKSG